MASEPVPQAPPTWRTALPTLTGRLASLREPVEPDAGALASLLSVGDACRFDVTEPSSEGAILGFIERVQRERTAGQSFTYAILGSSPDTIVGLLQVRQLDPGWEAAEWECTIEPAARGTGIFLEAAQLAGTFAFEAVGAHRLESRVLLQNGRANGALRKLGAVQEGVLRRSLRHGDTYFDQVLWSVIKEDWATHRVAVSGRVH